MPCCRSLKISSASSTVANSSISAWRPAPNCPLGALLLAQCPLYLAADLQSPSTVKPDSTASTNRRIASKLCMRRANVQLSSKHGPSYLIFCWTKRLVDPSSEVCYYHQLL